MNDQTRKIEALTTDVDRLRQQNADLQTKLKKVAELEDTITELQRELKTSRDDLKAANSEAQMLKAKLATKIAAPTPTASKDKALQEKYQALEEKHRSTETVLAEWTELAKVCWRSFTYLAITDCL